MPQSIVPYLSFPDAQAAIDFYQKAFGMVGGEPHRMPNGKILHASLKLDETELFLSDAMEGQCETGTNATGDSIMLIVADVDALWKRAVEAGCTVTMLLEDQFWGDRFGMIQDPFGRSWGLSQPMREVSSEEMKEGMAGAQSYFDSQNQG